MGNSRQNRFLGEYIFSLETKRRLTIPLAWRAGERERFILMPDAKEDAIRVVPDANFADWIRELRTTEFFQGSDLDWLQAVGRVSHAVNADGRGRLVLPNSLMEYAHLNVDAPAVVLIGAVSSFTIKSRDFSDYTPISYDQPGASYYCR